MFGLFKKKKIGEQLLNESLFVHHFSNIFNSSTFDSNKVPLAEKILMFSFALAYGVSEKAKGNEDALNESNSKERAASVVIFFQAANTIADFVMYSDKKKMVDIYCNGTMRLLCKNFDSPTPKENADMALASTAYKIVCREHIYISEEISENCLEWLFHQKDESITKLVTEWKRIVSIL